MEGYSMTHHTSAADFFTYIFGISFGALALYTIIILGLSILGIVAQWKLFTKAGKPGWGCLIPFYNSYCLMDMAFGNGWLFLLGFVPCVNLILSVMFCFKLASAFRMGTAFGFGLLFLNPIFILILGLGDYQYYGVDGVGFGSTGQSYRDSGWYR